MPKMDGFELIRQLRQSPVLKEKVIIASSASVYDADKDRSLAIGSNAFLPKPIQVETLLEQLQHHLELTWVYGNKLQETTEESSIAPMIFPPIGELKKLYELTLMADIDELEEHVTILAKDVELKAFVIKMQSFLEKYQVGKIKKWLEEVMMNDR
jgi:response regulator RpfG family c-di-GMP phosphodiesterase